MTRSSKRRQRYRFFLNPYTDIRFTRCPMCQGKTRQRKRPLVIHIEPMQLLSLNKTCRYCPNCDLLIAHQEEIEALLTAIHGEPDSDSTTIDYLVLGTIDRADWKKGTEGVATVQEILDQLYDFKEVLRFAPAIG